MKKVKLKFGYLLIIVTLIFLILTNPSPDHFRKSLPLLSRLPNVMFSDTKYSQYSIYGRKSNYIICSIYKFDLNGHEIQSNEFVTSMKVWVLQVIFIIINQTK